MIEKVGQKKMKDEKMMRARGEPKSGLLGVFLRAILK